MGMTKPEDIDDMLSELSTPGLDEDIAAQKKYIEQLLNRNKSTADQEEQELQKCFDQLKAGSTMNSKQFEDSVSEISD